MKETVQAGTFDEIWALLDKNNVSKNYMNGMFIYAAAYTLDAEKLAESVRCGLMASVMRLLPDVVQGVVKVGDVEKFIEMVTVLR